VYKLMAEARLHSLPARKERKSLVNVIAPLATFARANSQVRSPASSSPKIGQTPQAIMLGAA
jgi:hypothetical protein